MVGNALAIALYVWGLVAQVSSNNMEILFRILHALLPGACLLANLPKRYGTTVKMMAKAEKVYRGDGRGFITIRIPVDDPVLVCKRIKEVSVIRRSIKETVSAICQNPKNAEGSLRRHYIETPGVHGDVMSSPMLQRIENLVGHVWAASGIPEEEQLTIYTQVSKDGTAALRSAAMPVEASTLTLANLDRDHRNSNGNVKLLSVYRAPTLHNPTVSSQKKSKYKPTDKEKVGLR